MNRRSFLAVAAAAAQVPPEPRTTLGVSPDSFAVRRPARTALEFLQFAHTRGFGGVQAALPPDAGAGYLKAVRDYCERNGLYWELLAPLPEDDPGPFDQAVRQAKEAGALCIRSVCLAGRRYETFRSMDEWKEFVRRSHRRLALAVPVAEKHRLPLGIENHKDWTAAEMPEIFRKYSSEYLGACIDFGNNLALLDEPMELITALAPWVINTHVKDMGVEEYSDGFLLSEVPLGKGVVGLKAAIALLRARRPGVRFTMDTLVRDPLRIPCLTDLYWATFEQPDARRLARILRFVRANPPREPLPRVSGLSREQALALEDRILDECRRYAATELGLA
ncbi:MAG: sugar phosphate isomerase/epimerase [Bryobacteraceae bacterium]|nr:sugar phosphate isomerase/epimerase [Bryobacteraceae bacterium]